MVELTPAARLQAEPSASGKDEVPSDRLDYARVLLADDLGRLIHEGLTGSRVKALDSVREVPPAHEHRDQLLGRLPYDLFFDCIDPDLTESGLCGSGLERAGIPDGGPRFARIRDLRRRRQTAIDHRVDELPDRLLES